MGGGWGGKVGGRGGWAGCIVGGLFIGVSWLTRHGADWACRLPWAGVAGQGCAVGWLLLTCAVCCLCVVPTAPSQVSEVTKESVQQRSIQLSWHEPQQPNGVITEYEIKYYEKVSSCLPARPSASHFP